MRLEQLLRMTVPVPAGCVVPEGTPTSPEFRVAVQHVYANGGVHFIIHADGHSSDTLDLVAMGNQIMTLEQYEYGERMLPLTTNA